VKQAEADGLVVVINDQTESDSKKISGLSSKELDPTTATFAFWNCVTAHQESWRISEAYAQDPQVIFDIFNEPQADSCKNDGATYPNGNSLGFYDTNLWRNGGLSNGDCGPAENYQGMDAVAYHIRNEDSDTKTLLWVEGPGTAGTLAGLAQPDCGSTPTGTCFITPQPGPAGVLGPSPVRQRPHHEFFPAGQHVDLVERVRLGGLSPLCHRLGARNARRVDELRLIHRVEREPGQDLLVGRADSDPELPVLPEYDWRRPERLSASRADQRLPAHGRRELDRHHQLHRRDLEPNYCKPGTTAPLLGSGSLIRQWFQQQN